MPMGDQFAQWRDAVIDAGKQAADKMGSVAHAVRKHQADSSEATVIDGLTSSDVEANSISWVAVLVTLAIGFVIASVLWQYREQNQSKVGDVTSTSAATAVSAATPLPVSAVSSAAAGPINLPPPPSALPAPPSAALGGTMMMDASYVAVGSHESNGDQPEADFEIVAPRGM
eukprot:CAMPEP_0115853172 /NCGR_PEP_ID=MMETSP0287-20121206/13368_1 /TAXON_ID=412157 /ORGANISM="Chrysochromulina rotalis, Strain UIO044" /LENGTH=171 /DNA_ID=CAMNT_0003307243 /DNA_START=9 /DNA_END=524 /DNA_ORIENTATION=+